MCGQRTVSLFIPPPMRTRQRVVGACREASAPAAGWPPGVAAGRASGHLTRSSRPTVSQRVCWTLSRGARGFLSPYALSMLPDISELSPVLAASPLSVLLTCGPPGPGGKALRLPRSCPAVKRSRVSGSGARGPRCPSVPVSPRLHHPPSPCASVAHLSTHLSIISPSAYRPPASYLPGAASHALPGCDSAPGVCAKRLPIRR